MAAADVDKTVFFVKAGLKLSKNIVWQKLFEFINVGFVNKNKFYHEKTFVIVFLFVCLLIIDRPAENELLCSFGNGGLFSIRFGQKFYHEP